MHVLIVLGRVLDTNMSSHSIVSLPVHYIDVSVLVVVMIDQVADITREKL